MGNNDRTRRQLSEIFGNDPFRLLDVDNAEPVQRSDAEKRLIDSFQEIAEFYETHQRIPSVDGDLGEHRLATRLQALRSDPHKVKILRPLDMHNLLDAQNTRSLTVEDILGDDPLGLLTSDKESDGIFHLSHVKPTDRIRPEYVARRKVCKDFGRFKPLFEKVHEDLARGVRRLVEFREEDLSHGKYFVLRGVLFHLELLEDQLSVRQSTYVSGVYNRLDGRTKCVFDNGTESTMLYRSLVKAMRVDGFTVGEPELVERTSGTEITPDDVQNGYVYVLKSRSRSHEVREIQNLYKIGYCSGSVTERLKDASNEPTYLMSDVEIVLTARCFNMNARSLESAIHEFFGSANVEFEVKDNRGRTHYPREWFIAPMRIIEEACQLIVEQRIGDYRYDPELQVIIKKSNT